MDAYECLIGRQSTPPAFLDRPAPTGAALREVLAVAMRAPDHAALRPWRFLIIEDEARQHLGDVFAQALLLRQPDVDRQEVEKARAKPLRAPLIIVVWTDIVENHPKTPVIEQIIATGAAAQNMLNALHAMRFGGILLTGAPCYDPHVKAALGLETKDVIVGFLYIGTPKREMPPKARPDPMTFVRHWHGPDAIARAEE